MSWVLVVWSMIVSACLTLAGMHLLIWNKRRDGWANLLFSLAAIGTATLAAIEYCMMTSATTADYGRAVRWLHVPSWMILVAMVWFIHFHLRAGRLWLAWTFCGVRTLSLILNFVFTPNLNFREITALRTISFLGESVVIPEAIPNPWMLLGQLALLLFVIYVLDASITVWRRGHRRQALLLGGSMSFFAITGTVQAILVFWGILSMPITAAIFFMGVVVAMGYELSSDVLRAAELARDLKEVDERMNLAGRAGRFGIWMRDYAGDTIWCTESCRMLFALGESEPLNMERMLRQMHPEDRDVLERAVARAGTNGGEYECEYRIVLPGGEIRWIGSRGQVEFSGGHPVRLRGVSQDITERKRAEESTRSSQALMQAIFNSVPGLLYLYTEDGRLVRWNTRHELMTGYASDELLHFRAERWFDAVHWPEAARAIAEVFTKGYAEVETTMILKNGQRLPIFATGSRVLLAGKPHMVGIAIDISNRKRAEMELAQQRDELAHLSRVTTVSALSGALAHELNQPLGIILSNTQAAQELLAQDPPALGEIGEILSDIVAADRRAAEIIQRLRALLKRGETSMQPLVLNELLEEVLHLTRSDLIGRGVLVDCDLAPDLPAVTGTRVQIQQVALNLILNAADAMADNAPGTRRLHLTTVRCDDAVRITVRDEGIGLPADKERLFQAFFTTKTNGLGMGLAICRSIIAAHNGRIWAEPHPERGAIFHVELPVADAKVKP